MKLSIVAIAAGALFLTGCATSNNYELYAQTQQAIAMAKAEADIARYKVLEGIANSGDTTARVAAVIALQQGAPAQSNPQVAVPASTGDTALKWASVLVPSLTQFYSIGKSTDLAIVNSNNNKDIAINNNQSMVNMGRLIAGQEAPVIGNSSERLIYPEPTPVIVNPGEVVLFGR